jgi:hypothetical protein
MCECLKTQFVIAGWGCCGCNGYNGLQRPTCRACGKQRCEPLKPDKRTGEKFETYEEAYKDDPKRLEAINEQLARAAAEGR